MNTKNTDEVFATATEYLKNHSLPSQLYPVTGDKLHTFASQVLASFQFKTSPVDPNENKVKAMQLAACHAVFNICERFGFDDVKRRELSDFFVDFGLAALKEDNFYGFGVAYDTVLQKPAEFNLYFVGCGTPISATKPGKFNIIDIPRRTPAGFIGLGIVLIATKPFDRYPKLPDFTNLEVAQENPDEIMRYLSQEGLNPATLFSAMSVDQHWFSRVQYVR